VPVLISTLLAIAVLALIPSLGRALPPSDVYDLPKLTAIQNREYYLDHGIIFRLGVLPMDAFNKGLIAGASYTYYFTDYIGWEVLDFNYSSNSETNLKKDLTENFQVQVQNKGLDGVLDYVDYYVTSNLVYTPFYSKNLLFNKSVVHSETSFVFGGGVAKYHATGFKSLVGIGIIARYFTSRKTSWVFEARDNLYFDKAAGTTSILSLSIGYSFQLGSGRESVPMAPGASVPNTPGGGNE